MSIFQGLLLAGIFLIVASMWTIQGVLYNMLMFNRFLYDQGVLLDQKTIEAVEGESVESS